MENKIWPLVALIAGFFIGKNSDKIVKKCRPIIKATQKTVTEKGEEVKKFLEEQKKEAMKAVKKIVKPKRVKKTAAKAAA